MAVRRALYAETRPDASRNPGIRRCLTSFDGAVGNDIGVEPSIPPAVQVFKLDHICRRGRLVGAPLSDVASGYACKAASVDGECSTSRQNTNGHTHFVTACFHVGCTMQ